VHFFSHFNYNHPDTTVIVIAPASTRRIAETLATLGVEEIVTLPVNEEQKGRLIDRILLRLSHYDCLRAIQERLHHDMSLNQIVVHSKPMREIIQQLPKLAARAATVLITGETGTGKELFARAIHYLGPHADKPFVTVDCGAMPDHLVENELFGHARGAYTDAGSPSKGLIQEADGGTLFLDEVETLPLNVQAKFLRVLQERQYKPLGQSKYVSVNLRVLAATNIDLARAVIEKKFREDLYYRLNVVPLFIPPLRERKSDIPALVRFFLQRHGRDRQTSLRVPDEILRRWMEYEWPGNVRELENKVQQWLTVSATDDLHETAAFSTVERRTICTLAEARQDALAQFERAYLQNLLSHTKGNISAAARLAGTDRKNLRKLNKKYGIDASRFRL
jgi:DNA-binding NtrC family response regulator